MYNSAMSDTYTKKDAIKLIDAARYRDGWVFYADEAKEWVAFSDADLDSLVRFMNDKDPQVSKDAYSHWCCGVGRQVTDAAELTEITGVAHIEISVDYEHNCETWWDAAREQSAPLPPDAAADMVSGGADCAVLTKKQTDAFIAWAEQFPGWDESPFVINP